MRICFSTLACPTWTLSQVVEIASSSGYLGIELRFLEGEDSLWKLPVFQGHALVTAKRMIADRGLSITCVGTSCRFHSPDPQERERWVEEGKRMAELAAAMGAPGIRVFGDKIQPGEDRDATRGWIAEGIRKLAERRKKTESKSGWKRTEISRHRRRQCKSSASLGTRTSASCGIRRTHSPTAMSSHLELRGCSAVPYNMCI